MSTATRARRSRDNTPDSHLFPTRPYDLVKEFVVALAVVGLLTLLLAAVFSSPDRPALTLANWAQGRPGRCDRHRDRRTGRHLDQRRLRGALQHRLDRSAARPPATAEMGWGQHTDRQFPGPGHLAPDRQRASTADPLLASALQSWQSATDQQRTTWATRYGDALAAAPEGNPAQVAPGDYGPVPVLAGKFLNLAGSGALEGLLTSSSTFYSGDATKPLLLLADGAYLEDQARAEHLGGDQWGMMNETGRYPGQPWMWLYTFWYQIQPFAGSDNADALVWALMAILTLAFIFLPYIPGLRSLPRHLGVYRLIWRQNL